MLRPGHGSAAAIEKLPHRFMTWLRTHCRSHEVCGTLSSTAAVWYQTRTAREADLKVVPVMDPSETWVNQLVVCSDHPGRVGDIRPHTREVGAWERDWVHVLSDRGG